MKKYINLLFLLSTLSIIILVFPQISNGGVNVQPPPNVQDITKIVDNIKNLVWLIFTAAAVVLFIVAGILFLSAQGNPDKIAQARNAVIWGIAGVVVAIIGWSIITLVQNAILL